MKQEKEKLTANISEMQASLHSKEQALQQARTQAETEKVQTCLQVEYLSLFVKEKGQCSKTEAEIFQQTLIMVETEKVPYDLQTTRCSRLQGTYQSFKLKYEEQKLLHGAQVISVPDSTPDTNISFFGTVVIHSQRQ